DDALLSRNDSTRYRDHNSFPTRRSSDLNRSVIVMGGANIRSQIADLRRGVTMVVATPGRLLDLTERGAIDLSMIEVLVLDEADRDRKSTRLNSSHVAISYAVFCLKKKRI